MMTDEEFKEAIKRSPIDLICRCCWWRLVPIDENHSRRICTWSKECPFKVYDKDNETYICEAFFHMLAPWGSDYVLEDLRYTYDKRIRRMTNE